MDDFGVFPLIYINFKNSTKFQFRTKIIIIVIYLFFDEIIKNIYSRGSKVWTICMHLGIYALRTSDHDICGLNMIFACISDNLFSDWFPINSDSLWGIAADLVTVCHSIFRQCPRFKYNFLFFVTIRYDSSRFMTIYHVIC